MFEKFSYIVQIDVMQTLTISEISVLSVLMLNYQTVRQVNKSNNGAVATLSVQADLTINA